MRRVMQALAAGGTALRWVGTGLHGCIPGSAGLLRCCANVRLPAALLRLHATDCRTTAHRPPPLPRSLLPLALPGLRLPPLATASVLVVSVGFQGLCYSGFHAYVAEVAPQEVGGLLGRQQDGALRGRQGGICQGACPALASVHAHLLADAILSYPIFSSPAAAGLVLSITNTCGTLVGIAGTLATGWLAASPLGYSAVFAATALLQALCLVAWLASAHGRPLRLHMP